jgi:hypothetical protein
MRTRCYNPAYYLYERYGGRGVVVCEKWHRFSGFIEDMGIAPVGLSLDRIDSNGNYFKENCRWSSMKTQQRNRTNNLVIACFGEEKPLSEWAEDCRCSVSYATLYMRINELHWDVERSITERLQKKHSHPRKSSSQALMIKEIK